MRAQNDCGASYTVAAGDTLATIAKRCGTTVEALMAANAQIEDAGSISVGWELTVPGARASLGPDAEVRPAARGEEAEAALAAGSYEVQPGESFASIATTLKIPMRELMAANPEVEPFALRPGQSLALPETSAAESPLPDEETAGSPAGGPAPGSAAEDQPAGDEGQGAEGEPEADAARVEPLMLQGQVLGGAECPVLKTPEGDLYSLVSSEYGFTPGDYVEIEGETVDLSFCMEGRATVRVTSMTGIPTPQGG